MKYLIPAVCLSLLFVSCKNQNSKIVDKAYIDSMTAHFTVPTVVTNNEKDMAFWKARIDPKQARHVNEARYASTLVTRFRQFGDINDVKQAQAIQNAINKTYNNTLPGPFEALAGMAMLTHHFMLADTLLQKAVKVGIDNYSKTTLSFDVNFELGRYPVAKYYLSSLKKANDYNYFFRRSKMDHFNSNLDSAISGMMSAAAKEDRAPYLKGVALSNAGDLYIHAGDLQKAADLYKQCIKINSADFHSIMGLGWIALVHDKNDTLAEKIFKFVATKNKLPDPLFKLYQMAQGRGDIALEKSYATDFATKATDTVYGRMYNKYTIEIYTGVLNQPAKAEAIAKDELNNRQTPQSYAWYAYTLFKNGKKDDAYKVFEAHVSGQPLEGLELYYMGEMLKGLDKGYDADEYFKAADKNKYDLSPAMAKALEADLEE